MDVSEVARTLATGLTIPVLRVLAARSIPTTARRIWLLAGTGTEAGVRGAVERLADHGLLHREDIGGRLVYSINYEHVLYDAAEALLAASSELQRRLRGDLSMWDPAPVSAAIFGSAARRTGDSTSDIDLLLVRPLLTQSKRPVWARQVNELRTSIERWTGNRAQILDRNRRSVRAMVAAKDPIVEHWREDAITVYGTRLPDLLKERS